MGKLENGQLLSGCGFVQSIAPLSLSCDRRIKMKQTNDPGGYPCCHRLYGHTNTHCRKKKLLYMFLSKNVIKYACYVFSLINFTYLCLKALFIFYFLKKVRYSLACLHVFKNDLFGGSAFEQRTTRNVNIVNIMLF